MWNRTGLGMIKKTSGGSGLSTRSLKTRNTTPVFARLLTLGPITFIEHLSAGRLAQPREQVGVFRTEAVLRRIRLYSSDRQDRILAALDTNYVGTGFFREKVGFVQAGRRLLKDFVRG